MAANLRPLSTGELLDKTFTQYRQNFLLFFGIAALPQLVLFVLIAGTGMAFGVIGTRVNRVPALPAIAIAIGLAYIIGAIVAAAFTQAATTFAVSDLYLEEPASLKRSFSRARGRILAVLGVLIIFSLCLGIGFMLLLVPGILVLMWYSLAVPASVVEHIGVSDALNRSSRLSKGSGWRIFGVYVLLFIFTIVAKIAIQYIITLAVASLKSISPIVPLAAMGGTYLVSALVAPVITIALTLLYYDQPVRREGFDLEHMMNALQGGAGSAGAAAVGSPV